MSNVISQGAVVAVIGICTVFVVLAILWGVLELMRVIFTAKSKKPAAPAAPAPAPAPVAPAPAPAEDDSELIAVLTAAIAASLNQTTTYNLKIKSYRRVDASTPVWNRTARRDNLIG
ncbi:MAG: OadG family protein [Clostridia bacterium]|nr:OadG family protein [Clostridia bacterium]